MNDFLSGAMMMGFGVAGLFFLRYFRDSRDRLFLFFGVAFWILSLNRVAIAVVASPEDVSPLFYVIRLVAFVLILVGIVDKNRSA
jgi:hypothetical protein